MPFGAILKFTHRFPINSIHSPIHTQIHRSFIRFGPIEHEFSRTLALGSHDFGIDVTFMSHIVSHV